MAIPLQYIVSIQAGIHRTFYVLFYYGVNHCDGCGDKGTYLQVVQPVRTLRAPLAPWRDFLFFLDISLACSILPEFHTERVSGRKGEILKRFQKSRSNPH